MNTPNNNRASDPPPRWIVKVGNGMSLPGTRHPTASDAIERAERITGRRWTQLEADGYTCVPDRGGLPCSPLVTEP